MDDLTQQLQKVLSDPQTMGQLQGLLSSLGGQEEKPAPAPSGGPDLSALLGALGGGQASPPPAESPSTALAGLNPQALSLMARLGPKIVKKASFTPTVLHTKRGETVLDFGQNMTGWVEFDVSEPAGTEVVLTYGEVLQDGCFYRDNLRSAKAEYRYISKGEKAHVRPHGTFYGFRYVKVEGMEEVNPADFTACVLHSDLETTGCVETSDPRVNRLFLNAMWGQRGNFLDVPVKVSNAH